MSKAQIVFEKLAFIAPFTIKDKKELQSVKGYAKEVGNMMTGLMVGSIPGIALAIAKKPLISVPVQPLGASVGAYLSLRKSERKAGVKPSGIGKLLARNLGALAFFGLPGDYFVSRKVQKYEDLPRNK